MTYSDYSLSAEEYEEFLKTKRSTKLHNIWEDLLRRIDDTELQEEAKSKGYELVDNPDVEDDVIAFYKMLVIPESSPRLNRVWSEDLYPFVVCLKD